MIRLLHKSVRLYAVVYQNRSSAMSDIKDWIAQAIQDENFCKYKVEVTGHSEKGENYMSDITYVRVQGITENGEDRTINLVIKASKNNIELRKKSPTKESFEVEFYAYQKVLTAFNELQERKCIKEMFSAYPKCYKYLALENQEVILMENLKPDGYVVHDRFTPMNIEHCKTVLKEFANLHALGFALKDQDKESFDSLFKNTKYAFGQYFVKSSSMVTFYDDSLTEALESIRSKGGSKLCDDFYKIAPRSASEMVVSILGDHDDQNVFTHGDGWNNNFLFKYEDVDQKVPSKVAIIDWQLSSLASPMYDVSQFLYAVCSQDQLDHFDELIQFYYQHLSSFLEELGSCPGKLFTFEDLKGHWKRAGLAGLIQASVLMKFILCDKDSAPDFQNVTEDADPGDVIQVRVYDREKYHERIKAAFGHFVEYYKKN